MSNKQLLQSAGDGTTVPAGYIGEKITWTTPPTTVASSASMGAAVDWTNATFTLGAGVWEIKANVLVEITTATTAGGATDCYIYITDSTNALVQNQSKAAGLKTPANAITRTKVCLSFAFVENLTTSKTYKIRYQQDDAIAAGTINVFNQTNLRSEFYAVRLA